MQFNLDINRDSYSIRAYGSGSVTVTIPQDSADPAAIDAIGPTAARSRQEVMNRSLIITPRKLIRDWPPQTLAELTATHMQALVALRPEVILLGSGTRFAWPEPAALAPLMQAGIGYEVMDTAAACRTYNILMSDGRRVAAALLMID